MNLELPISRKTDFIVALAAVLLLWGPGLSIPWGRKPELTRPAQASYTTPLPVSPCEPDAFPEPEKADASRSGLATVRVTITGYSSSAGETDSSPGLTAANTRVRHGVMALSQDLLREFTPGAPFGFHDRVEIPGLGQFMVEDTMHPRWTRRADLWFPSRSMALQWGRRTRQIYRLPGDLASELPMPGPQEMAASFGKANFQ